MVKQFSSCLVTVIACGQQCTFWNILHTFYKHVYIYIYISWWHHQMETFSVLLAMCAGNSPVTGEFPAQRPVTRSFDVFFDLSLIKRLSKQSLGWWFETSSRPLWRHCNVLFTDAACVPGLRHHAAFHDVQCCFGYRHSAWSRYRLLLLSIWNP